jgi:hypothetical protein
MIMVSRQKLLSDLIGLKRENVVSLGLRTTPDSVSLFESKYIVWGI